MNMYSVCCDHWGIVKQLGRKALISLADGSFREPPLSDPDYNAKSGKQGPLSVCAPLLSAKRI